MLLMAASLFLRYGFNTKVCSFVMLLWVLAIALLTDVRHGIIPNSLVVAGVVIWIVGLTGEMLEGSFQGVAGEMLEGSFQGMAGEMPGGSFQLVLQRFLAGALGAGVTAGGLLLFSVIYEQSSGKPSFGGGDIKLLFVVGLFFGLEASMVNLLLACAFGLLFAYFWRARQLRAVQEPRGFWTKWQAIAPYWARAAGEVNGTTVFPFGPAIAAAGFLMILLGVPPAL